MPLTDRERALARAGVAIGLVVALEAVMESVDESTFTVLYRLASDRINTLSMKEAPHA